MIKTFYKKNYNIIILNLFFIFSMFLTNIILNPILIKEYLFKEEILTYTNMFFSIGVFIATFVVRYFLNFRLNYLKLVNFGLLNLILLYFVYISLIFLNQIYDSILIQWIYVILRISEGFSTNLISFILGYFISMKLLNNDFKGTINGFLSSKIYLIKFISPIIASYIILLTNFNLLILFVSIFINIGIYIFLKINKKKIFYRSFKYILKKHKLKKEKINLFNKRRIISLRFFKGLISSKVNNIFLISEIFIQNSFRPFYDIYLILIFTLVFKFDLTTASLLFSFMIAGNALSFVTSYIFDNLYLNKNFYNEFYQTIPGNFLMLIHFIWFYYILIHFESLDNLFFIISIFMVSFGIIRNIYNDRSYRSILFLSSNKGNLENYKSSFMIVSELSHIISYFFIGVTFAIFSYQGILIFFTVLSALLFIQSLVKFVFFKEEGFIQTKSND